MLVLKKKTMNELYQQLNIFLYVYTQPCCCRVEFFFVYASLTLNALRVYKNSDMIESVGRCRVQWSHTKNNIFLITYQLILNILISNEDYSQLLFLIVKDLERSVCVVW